MSTTEDIADAVVALLTALPGKLVDCVVAKPDVIPEYENETDTVPRLDVIPYEEREESIAADDSCKSLLTVTIVASWPATGSNTRVQSIAAMRQFRDALRGHTVDRYRWQRCENVSLFDADVLRLKNRFLSVFRATYFDVN